MTEKAIREAWQAFSDACQKSEGLEVRLPTTVPGILRVSEIGDKPKPVTEGPAELVKRPVAPRPDPEAKASKNDN